MIILAIKIAIIVLIVLIFPIANIIAWHKIGKPRGEPWNWRVPLGAKIYHNWYRKHGNLRRHRK